MMMLMMMMMMVMLWVVMFLMMVWREAVLFSVGVLPSVWVRGRLAADTVQATRLDRSLPSACREQILVCGLCSRPRLRKRCG